MSSIDTPLTPSMKGKRSLNAYIKGIAFEELQKERDAVLACSLEDIRKAADVIEKVVSKDNICVIGNEKHIKDEAELFDNISVLS